MVRSRPPVRALPHQGGEWDPQDQAVNPADEVGQSVRPTPSSSWPVSTSSWTPPASTPRSSPPGGLRQRADLLQMDRSVVATLRTRIDRPMDECYGSPRHAGPAVLPFDHRRRHLRRQGVTPHPSSSPLALMANKRVLRRPASRWTSWTLQAGPDRPRSRWRSCSSRRREPLGRRLDPECPARVHVVRGLRWRHQRRHRPAHLDDPNNVKDSPG